MMISQWIFKFFLVQQAFNLSADFDHKVEWKTIETEHFYLHYPHSLEDPAYRLSAMVEPIRERLTTKFRWSQADKVHVVLSDFTDESNGLSTPLPYNLIYLYVAPPTDDTALDNYDEWLRMLFTHEFTHSVHIDMANGISKFLRYLLGRFIVPNGAQQQWGIEGIAELEETVETTRGRGRSPFVEMYLRTSILENKFLPIERATYWHDTYPFGNAAYFYGIGFYQYLAKTFGEEKIYDFTEETSRWPLPGFMNFKTKNVFGKSFARLWAEWQNEQRQRWESFRVSHPTPPLNSALTESPERIEGTPMWDESGSTLYVSVSDMNRAEARAFHFAENGQVTSEKLFDGAPHRLFVHGNHLIFSRVSFVDTPRRYSDIYSYDLESKKTARLTRGLRVRDPIVIRKNVIAVRTDSLRTTLVQFPLPENLSDSEAVEDNQLTDPKQMEILFAAHGYDTISRPSASPDGRVIVFSMREEMKQRHLYLFDLQTKTLHQLTEGPYEEYGPAFSTGGRSIIFSSARPLGNDSASSSLVPNIFSLDLDSKKVSPLTQVITGADYPAVSKNRLAFGHFRSSGYELQTLTHSLSNSTSAARADAFPIKKIGETTAYSLPLNAHKGEYDSHSALLPHYLLPFFFYTESDTAVGAATSTFDPLQYHTWGAAAWYLSTPKRPGGSLSYSYRGFDRLTLSLDLVASMTDYGNILFRRTSAGTLQQIADEHYYERNYIAAASFMYGIFTRNGFSGFSLGNSFFYERREPLIAMPTGAVTGRSNLTVNGTVVASDVLLGPETGNRYGVSGLLTYETKTLQSPTAESPSLGTKLRALVEYSPKAAGSDFHQLLTLISGKTFFELLDGHYFAANAAAGLQWLKPVYQRSFQLGGSFGESPFVSVNKRIHPLRGMAVGEFKGEGLVTGSAEYRLSLFRLIPGFGSAPIWFKNLYAALFTDVGQTFEWKHDMTLIEYATKQMHRIGWNRFSQSFGGELRSSVSLSYAPPLVFRLGYGHLLFLEGENVFKQNMHEVYFAAGTSF
jgi:hypothetical protein